MKTYGLGVLILGCMLLAGCGSQPSADSNAAIRQAIEKHLAGRSDLAADKMTMEIKNVRLEGERAEAEVIFRTTSGPPAQMAFLYQLRREGREWQVEKGSPSASNSPHPSSPAPDSGYDGAADPLPEGHPPITSPH
ncbi:MAG: hypothetical protein HY313_06910 [Acidobacteria bacterium]|nr:hypothetical protein [Acidobacteriota bacterium]